MIWSLLIMWNVKTKPASSSWVGMAFKTEADCRYALKTTTVSDDIAKNSTIVCREMKP